MQGRDSHDFEGLRFRDSLNYKYLLRKHKEWNGDRCTSEPRSHEVHPDNRGSDKARNLLVALRISSCNVAFVRFQIRINQLAGYVLAVHCCVLRERFRFVVILRKSIN